MKRTLALFMSILLLFSLAGCTEESAASAAPHSGSDFTVRFIDVGQADAALIECDGHFMLIDGGNKEDSNRIYSVLEKQQVPVLDLVVGTHAHEDHIGGIPGAFSYTDAHMTLCPVTEYESKAFSDFKRYAEEKGGGITVPQPGDSYPLGSALVTILGLNSGTNTNDTSIILRIDYGETSFLFTGDAEREGEQAVLENGANLKADVLKVGHHGSSTSTGYYFLRQVNPLYAVISVGKDNSYGHPDDEVLSRLQDADVQVFRTDLEGDIVCTSDGKTVHFEGYMDPAPDAESAMPSESLAAYRFILNTGSKKFHLPSCPQAEKISAENRQESAETRETLISQGYSPCGHCHP